jgi:hypothetical protein
LGTFGQPIHLLDIGVYIRYAKKRERKKEKKLGKIRKNRSKGEKKENSNESYSSTALRLTKLTVGYTSCPTQPNKNGSRAKTPTLQNLLLSLFSFHLFPP